MMYGNYNVLLGCVVLFLAVYYYITAKYSYWKNRGVKGPTPLPIIGNFGKIIFGKTSMGDFLKEFYDKYRDEPVIGIYSGFEPILIVKDPDFIKNVLIKDFSIFADRGIPTNEKVEAFAGNLFAIDAKRWRLLRAKLSPTFSSGKLKDMFYLLRRCSENFGQYLDKLVSKDEIVDCRAITSKFTADVIGTCAFGIDLNTMNEEECEFLQVAKTMMKPRRKQFLRDIIKSFMPWLYNIIGHYLIDHEINEYFSRTIIDTIEYRWKHNLIKHDFVDILLDLKKHPEKLPELELTDNIIVAQAVAFFIAGFFASSVTMSHILYQLALNPQMQKELRTEIMAELEKTDGVMGYENIKTMSYLDAVFKEILRRYPPVTHLMRRSLEDYTFPGTQIHIPKKQRIWIPIYPIHLDPNIYPDPKVFDPERFRKNDIESVNPMCYLPFGDGSRNCIGARFAVHQTKAGIVEIVKNFQLDICEKTNFSYGKQARTFVLAPTDNAFLKFTKIDRT